MGEYTAWQLRQLAILYRRILQIKGVENANQAGEQSPIRGKLETDK